MTAEFTDDAYDITDLAGKYLTFSLNQEEFALSILKVKEIIGMQEITKIPKAPDFVLGVINLRGKVSPVISLRRKFGMDDIAFTERTCIVLVELTTHRTSMLLGIVVDSVSEVLNIRPAEIEPPPSFGAATGPEFIMGMAKTETGVKILLNIDQILTHEELAAVKKAKG